MPISSYLDIFCVRLFPRTRYAILQDLMISTAAVSESSISGVPLWVPKPKKVKVFKVVFRGILYHLTRGCCCCCYHPIYFGRQTAPFGIICGCTSQSHTGGGPHRSSYSIFLLRCLPSFLSRKGFSRPFSSSTVKSNFVYPRHNRSPLVGGDVTENPSSCDCPEIRTHVPRSEGFEVIN